MLTVLISVFSAFFAAYLLGSIPFGLLAGRLRGVDLREKGSGNIGATNALRVLGKKTGYAVFALDFLKGFTAVFAAKALTGGMEPAAIAAAVGVILGHNFPVWLRFKGGKGIATSGGVIIALFGWTVFVAALFVWLAAFLLTRYVSLASILGAVALPASLTVLALRGDASWLLVAVGAAMAAMAVWRHRSNIARLAAGTESRFTRKKDLAKSAANGEERE